MIHNIKYFACCLLLITACSKETRIRFAEAEITSTTVPQTGKVANALQIQATAMGSNGCWSDIRFEFTKQSEFEFTLKAYGFVSGDVCPAAIVTKDTVINFIPEKVGNYKVKVNQKANVVEVKDISVNKIK